MAREQIPYIQAIGEAVHQEMARDDTLLYFGQNLAHDAAQGFLGENVVSHVVFGHFALTPIVWSA